MRNHSPSLVLALCLAAGCTGKGGGSTPPQTVDVAGRVVNSQDQPVAGAQVKIGGTVSTTDVAGNFSATDVVVPYELILNDVPTNQVVAYLGVTRNNPVVRSNATASTATSAQVSGTITPSVESVSDTPASRTSAF